ncbi:MAG: PAS domain S-box protein [Magnetococcales bacterium]|nr:PAS domain S-box protein [Magnetococcales bacterium]
MKQDTLTHLQNADISGPVEIVPKIWWVGHFQQNENLQCHTYLIEDGESSVLIDPGSVKTINGTIDKIRKVIPLEHIRYYICQHQDPDITAALPAINKERTHNKASVISHARLNVFLKHYDVNFNFLSCNSMGWELNLQHRRLQFIHTPYLHSPGSFCTFDEVSGVLFTSDIFGGFSKNWSLLAKDESYFDDIRPFHENYMPTREILNSGLANLEKLPVKIIAPQHGSIIPSELIGILSTRLKGLECDLDMHEESVRHHRIFQSQEAISNILKTAMEPLSLNELLAKSLKILLSVPWLSIQSKGSIFLKEDDSHLEMAVYQGLAEQIVASCSRIKKGFCLCGRAAQSRQVIFSSCLDEQHEVRYGGIKPHGHYCVPILHGEDLMGVINLYLESGHKRNDDEVVFLQSVANTLAGLIRQKHIEESLKETEEKFNVLAASAQEAIIMVGSMGNVKFWNKAAEHLFGYKADEVFGRNMHSFIAPDRYVERIKSGFTHFQKTGEGAAVDKTVELAGKHKDGSEFPIELSISALKHKDKWQAIGVVRDITVRKREENRERFASYQAGIAEMSVSVLHNIGNAIMSIVNRSDEVIRASHDLGDIADLVAKLDGIVTKKIASGKTSDEVLAELRPALNEVANDLKALSSGSFLDNASKIRDGVEHISEIVKIQQNAGQSAAHRTRFDLKQLVDDALVLQKDSIEKFSILVEAKVSNGLDDVNLPRSQLLQMMVNLIKNSKEAIVTRTKDESITGKIEVSAKLVSEGMCEIRVKDNGCGMLKEQNTNIFRYGYTTKTRGTGYGLHSVSNFVQSLGGTISANSPGKNMGFEIVLKLPIADKTEDK